MLLFPPESRLRYTPAKLFFKNGGLRYSNLVSECASDPPQRAMACNTQEKTAGGRWGILNKSYENEYSVPPQYEFVLKCTGVVERVAGTFSGCCQ